MPSKFVLAVTESCRWQSAHWYRPRAVVHAVALPQARQMNPLGHGSCARYVKHTPLPRKTTCRTSEASVGSPHRRQDDRFDCSYAHTCLISLWKRSGYPFSNKSVSSATNSPVASMVWRYTSSWVGPIRSRSAGSRGRSTPKAAGRITCCSLG